MSLSQAGLLTSLLSAGYNGREHPVGGGVTVQEQPVPEARPRQAAGADERTKRQIRDQMRRGYQEMATLNLALSQEGPLFEMGVPEQPSRRGGAGGAPGPRGQVGFL